MFFANNLLAILRPFRVISGALINIAKGILYWSIPLRENSLIIIGQIFCKRYWNIKT